MKEWKNERMKIERMKEWKKIRMTILTNLKTVFRLNHCYSILFIYYFPAFSPYTFDSLGVHPPTPTPKNTWLSLNQLISPESTPLPSCVFVKPFISATLLNEKMKEKKYGQKRPKNEPMECTSLPVTGWTLSAWLDRPLQVFQ